MAKTKDQPGKTVTVEQIHSPQRRPKEQRATLVGLGLKRLRSRNTLADTPEVQIGRPTGQDSDGRTDSQPAAATKGAAGDPRRPWIEEIAQPQHSCRYARGSDRKTNRARQ